MRTAAYTVSRTDPVRTTTVQKQDVGGAATVVVVVRAESASGESVESNAKILVFDSDSCT